MTLEEKIIGLLNEQKISFEIKSFKVKGWDLRKLSQP